MRITIYSRLGCTGEIVMNDEKALGVRTTQSGKSADDGLFTGVDRPQPDNVDTASAKRKADPVKNAASTSKHN